ncbi:hypothetical protein [Acinetobacter bereziniae]|uniref:hypothetical protein n=1 Tax=Acinetobacter bereziniae TaxID=106648 RepID=UPI003AF45D60
MKKILLFILFLPVICFAESSFDAQLKKMKIIDNNYNVIDWDRYNELLRITTNNLAPLYPRQTDAYTTILSLTMDRFGINYVYLLKGMESKDQYESFLSDEDVKEGLKNISCSPEFVKTEVFRRNKGDSINIAFVSEKLKPLGQISFSSSDCY